MRAFNSLLHFLTLISIFSCSQKHSGEFYLPAEWEYQSGIIVNGLDDSATFEMVIQLSKETKVYCITADSLVKRYKEKCSDAGIILDSIGFITSSQDVSVFAERDGPLFMKNTDDQKQLVNFSWNAYGWFFEKEFEKYIGKENKEREAYIAAHSAAFKFPVITSAMVNEGGAIETNGKGTIIQVESVNMHRNPNMSKEQQEVEIKRILNAKKIIWLKDGAAEDPFGWGTLIAENYFGNHRYNICDYSITDPVQSKLLGKTKQKYSSDDEGISIKEILESIKSKEPELLKNVELSGFVFH